MDQRVLKERNLVGKKGQNKEPSAKHKLSTHLELSFTKQLLCSTFNITFMFSNPLKDRRKPLSVMKVAVLLVNLWNSKIFLLP